MQAIASALTALPDEAARTRVLRRAAEHFDAAMTPRVLRPQPAQAATASQAVGDPCNLESIFDDGMAPSLVVDEPVQRWAKPAVVAALHNFVSDFQKLARDWPRA